ncbi:MAG: SusC/RagA family TonB-linked outer membrane protein, partial [Bacteroidales bacterium]|nr:SusC/RagA family TonB-linked outer membrane protein [Bacteroidales bacterium]
MTDNLEEPLAGVYVFVKGSKNGVITDIDGKYALDVAPGNQVIFSFVGFKEHQENIVAGMRSVLNVTMTQDVAMLDETVVIGYGNTQKIKDVTGSISHIGSNDIKAIPMGSSLQSTLQGKAAGVNVQIQSASPTSPVSVIIRGQSSLSGNNQPLWVIDGIPEYNAGMDGSVSNVLYSLNLNDVESIDILKDASSTAIYGSRAANGVIVVTTKSGKEGMKPTLEFNAKVGWQFMNFNGYDYFTADDYIKFTRAAVRKELYNRGAMDYFTRIYLDEQAFLNMNSSEINTALVPDKKGAFYGEDNYWMGLMTQNPLQQQYDLTLRGGTKAISYLASLGYHDWQGIVKTGYSKMFNGRVRLEARIRDNLKFRINVAGNTRNASDKDYMLSVLKKVRPDLPRFNADGTIFTKDSYTENPYTTLASTATSTGENITSMAEIEWTIIKGLMFTSSGSINYSNTESLYYDRSGTANTTTGSRSWSRPKSDTKLWDNTLLYANKFGKHDLSASITASMERYQIATYSMSASNFPDDDVLNSFSNAASKGYMRETYNAQSMLSQVGRIQYNYDSRYLATFTIRHDGSSKFGPNKRWGWFPSAGIGWTISNEPWMKSGWVGRNISHLKIRASYGKAGSQNLSNYQWMSMVGSAQYNESPGIYPSNIGNRDLQWEESWMTDVFLEAEFWNSRIRASVGYFNKLSDNLIYNLPLPPSSSFSSMTGNVAKTRTDGLEFTFDFDIVKNSRWQLTFNANGSTNKSKIEKFNDAITQISGSYDKKEAGMEIGQFYGYKSYMRLYGSSEEAAALNLRNENGSLNYYWQAYNSAGDIYLMDLNGDGKITTDDKTYLGSAVPKLFGGFGLQAYIGTQFSIGCTFTYSIGNKRLWSMPMTDVGYTGNYNQSNKIAGMSAILNSPYLATTFPNATPYGDGSNGTFSDYWLYDASYVRLNTLNVSYRLGNEYFGRTIVDN